MYGERSKLTHLTPTAPTFSLIEAVPHAVGVDLSSEAGATSPPRGGVLCTVAPAVLAMVEKEKARNSEAQKTQIEVFKL
jgi:hypothetical protein